MRGRGPRTYPSLDELPRTPRVVTIGTFDGVHRGHQLLLERTVERARELGIPELAVTFEPIPAQVLRPDRFPGRICSAAEKLACLAAAGVDEILTLRFDLQLAAQTAEAFMAALSEATNLRELWVGEAFALGRNRRGDVARLREIGRELGFEVVSLPRLTNGDAVISSSAIRTAVLNGEVAQARRLLGRPFRVQGVVVHGAHFGRTIGYPTANVLPPPDQVPLADGIYVSWATLADGAGRRQAMTYVGTRPTVNTGARAVETNILDFAGDLYGQVLTVDVLERLRGDETFATIEELVAQLRRDEAATRAFFARGRPGDGGGEN